MSPLKIQANTIRAGNIIEHNGKQWSVIKVQLLQPGKGSAFAQVEMRDIRTGNKSNERFRTSENVERLMTDEKECTYLYLDGENLVLMDTESYEQFTVTKDLVGEAAVFLQDGMAVTVQLVDSEPVSVTPPATAVMEVVESDPVLKGQTAAASYKPALLENGVRIMVPPHVEVGTRVVVNTGDSTYSERAKD